MFEIDSTPGRCGAAGALGIAALVVGGPLTGAFDREGACRSNQGLAGTALGAPVGALAGAALGLPAGLLLAALHRTVAD